MRPPSAKTRQEPRQNEPARQSRRDHGGAGREMGSRQKDHSPAFTPPGMHVWHARGLMARTRPFCEGLVLQVPAPLPDPCDKQMLLQAGSWTTKSGKHICVPRMFGIHIGPKQVGKRTQQTTNRSLSQRSLCGFHGGCHGNWLCCNLGQIS